MFENGQLIDINGVRFVYDGVAYPKFNLHKLCEIGVDDHGKVFATDNVWYFTDEELAQANEPNPEHWASLVKRIVADKCTHLTDEQVAHLVTVILDKGFDKKVPKMDELNDWLYKYTETEDWWGFFNMFDAGVVSTIDDALAFFCKRCGVPAAIVYDNNAEDHILRLYTTQEALLDDRNAVDVKWLRLAIRDILHNEAYEVVIVGVRGGFINMAEKRGEIK